MLNVWLPTVGSLPRPVESWVVPPDRRVGVERTPAGVTIAQIGRELDVRPDQLRAWVRLQWDAVGTGTPLTGETPEQELRRLRREFATLRQEHAFAKEWRCTSRKSRDVICRDRSPSGRVPGATQLPRPRGLGRRLLCERGATRELARDDR